MCIFTLPAIIPPYRDSYTFPVKKRVPLMDPEKKHFESRLLPPVKKALATICEQVTRAETDMKGTLSFEQYSFAAEKFSKRRKNMAERVIMLLSNGSVTAFDLADHVQMLISLVQPFPTTKKLYENEKCLLERAKCAVSRLKANPDFDLQYRTLKRTLTEQLLSLEYNAAYFSNLKHYESTHEEFETALLQDIEKFKAVEKKYLAAKRPEDAAKVRKTTASIYEKLADHFIDLAEGTPPQEKIPHYIKAINYYREMKIGYGKKLPDLICQSIISAQYKLVEVYQLLGRDADSLAALHELRQELELRLKCPDYFVWTDAVFYLIESLIGLYQKTGKLKYIEQIAKEVSFFTRNQHQFSSEDLAKITPWLTKGTHYVETKSSG